MCTGTGDIKIKLTGILSTAGLPEGGSTGYGTKLTEHLYTANHQHFFCVRLDMQVDGPDNRIVEVDTVPAPADENPFGNAFRAKRTVLATEQRAKRHIDPFAGRYWAVTSTTRTNKMGTPSVGCGASICFAPDAPGTGSRPVEIAAT